MINLERLGSRVSKIARMTAVTLAIAILGMLAIAWGAWTFLPIEPNATGVAKLAMATLLAISVITFSPTMSAAVIAETGARGRLSELVLGDGGAGGRCHCRFVLARHTVGPLHAG
jgi:hypothetical protein